MTTTLADVYASARDNYALEKDWITSYRQSELTDIANGQTDRQRWKRFGTDIEIICTNTICSQNYPCI